MFAANDKAAILVEALPYIQEFYGKIVVVKYGGNAMINEELKEKVMQDVSLMKYVGIQPVIVHGGGPEITGFLGKVGKETEFISGLRVTDAETVEIAANLIRAKKKLATVYEGEESKMVDIGYVGEVEAIDTRLLRDLIAHDYIPVIAPIGVGADGESYNINADYVAAEIAGALGAEKLLLLTDVEGVYKDYEDKTSFISTLTAAEARRYIEDGTLTGGMIPKVEACLRALEAGAAKTHIIDGRLSHSIILEIFTSAGIGTQVEK